MTTPITSPGLVSIEHWKVLPLDTVIGNNMKFLRERESLSQADLAERLAERSGKAWDQQLISKAERGIRPFRVLDLLALAQTFQVSTLRLLTDPGVGIDAGNMTIYPDELLSHWVVHVKGRHFTEEEIKTTWPEHLSAKEET